MNHDEYSKMDAFEKVYWWHRGKRYVLNKLLKTYFLGSKSLKILEVGCGAGTITKKLQENHNIMGIDIAKEAIDICKKKGIKNVKEMDIFDLDINKFKNKFDLVLALDVLEHIQHDKEAMKIIYETLKPGGYFFVNVPAHKFLWSEHDEALQHKRRYTKYEIRKKLESAGFSISKETYFVMFVSPAIVLYRTWRNLFSKSAYPKTSYVKLAPALNNVLTKLLEFEAKLIKSINLPIGTTIIVIARKN